MDLSSYGLLLRYIATFLNVHRNSSVITLTPVNSFVTPPTTTIPNVSLQSKASNICPMIGDMTDELRNIVLQKHNEFRSELARGKSIIKGGNFAPSAKNMYKMEYSCELEKIAQNWANGCVFQHSSPILRRRSGENLYMMSRPGYDPVQALTDASTLWWDELRDLGGITSTNVQLTMDSFNLGIGHWSQMAWAKTTRVGCAYKSCPTMTYVVCNYSPAGNYINQNIYEIGSPCEANDACSTYAQSTCDIKSGLCSIN